MLFVALAVAAAATAWIGLSSAFLPCTLDCGETYEAHIGALNLYRFGLRAAAGLQDFAASPEPSGHPTLYIHNPNLALYYFYLLFLLGLRDVHAQAAATLVPFGAGLLYLYLFLRALTRDAFFAALGLLTASTLYVLVILWAFQPLRGFSWLITFGTLHHLLQCSRRRGWPLFHLVAAAVLMGLAFGIDYPFAIFLATTILALRALRMLPISWSRLVLLVALAFGVPVVLRQFQVMAGVGVELWAMDLRASLVHRVPALGLVLQAPSTEEIGRAYADRHIIKWPGVGEFTPLRWVARIGLAYLSVLGLPFVLVAGLWGAAALKLRRSHLRWASRAGGRAVVAAFCASLALAAGTLATFLLFPEYFTAFYGVVLMPLVVHWVVVVLTLALYLLLAYRRATVRCAGRMVPVGTLLLVAFVAWRVVTEVMNYVALPPRPYPGRQALKELAGHSVATFWISSAVSSYTGQWAASLNDARWRFLRPQDLPFDPARDYYFFMEADKDNPRYRTPDFLFVPRLHVPLLDNRVCRPLRGRINALADGCSDLQVMTRRLSWLPLHRRESDYLLYDLRPAYRRRSEHAQ